MRIFSSLCMHHPSGSTMQNKTDLVDHGFMFVVGQDVCSQTKGPWQHIVCWQSAPRAAVGGCSPALLMLAACVQSCLLIRSSFFLAPGMFVVANM